MTTLRSNWPSRLRQLLSSEGAIGPSIKLDSEPPPKVKAFIEKVIQCPLQDIAIPLSGFRWEYDKGNFHHWRPLLLHFDTYFKTYLSCRNDLTLLDNLEVDSPLPKHDILQILRVMQIILENCPNKSTFDGIEHFKLLLASTDPEILIAALETLSALVKINPSKLHGNAKMVSCGSVNSSLLSLAQGWGSKEEGLGLYSCVMANEKAQNEALSLFPSDVEIGGDQSNYRIGTTLYFELHGPSAQSEERSADTSSPGMRVIHMPDLHLRKEDDLSLLKQCIEQYNIPSELRFSLLSRIRYAHAFRSPRICRLYSRICLLSFIVLVQSGDAHDELVSFFANEPEYTNELIRIVRSEETISGSIRTLAMLALGAQLAAYTSSHERARILSGSSSSFAGGNRMILLNVLQKAILSLKNSSDPSTLAFVEALLQFYLLHVVSTSTSGSSIRGSGMVPTFLPLLEDSDPAHVHLVCFAVKTLQKLMDYSSSAVSLFKELGGIELLSQRLWKEVQRVIEVGENDNMFIAGESSRHSTDQLYSQKRLIKVSLKALGSATYAPANALPSKKTYIVHMKNHYNPTIYPTHQNWYSSTLQSLSLSTDSSNLDSDDVEDETETDPLLYSYTTAYTGFAAKLNTQQADTLLQNDDVLGVYEDTLYHLHTTRTPQFLGLETQTGLWEGHRTQELDQASHDVIIGVLDTGVWPESLSFNDAGLPEIPTRWRGACENAPDFNSSVCNRKLIGARSFSRGFHMASGKGADREIVSPRDSDGHGTHTASTAAGAHVGNASFLGYAAGTARGMAPQARVAAYKVCWKDGCFASDILAGMDRAIQDGVDVLSLSLGGGSAPYFHDTIAIGAFAAVERGIFVSASAGNSGPTRASLANVAPWIMTVGAGTLDRDFPAYATLGNKKRFSGVSLYSGKGMGNKPVSLVYFKGTGSNQSASICMAGSLEPAMVRGKVVVCDRGISARVEKGRVVKEAGGIGMILANTAASGEELVADSHLLPAVAVGRIVGDQIRKYVSSDLNPTAVLSFGGTVLNVRPSPVVAAFSSRGPNMITKEILKPDVIGPGVNILAGWSEAIGPSGLDEDTRKTKFNIMSGTSMSCPHISGLAALLKAAHPTWSPSAIKSALMTTAYNHDNSKSPLRDAADGSFSTPLAHGAGHVNPQKALSPGLVYDASTKDYITFLCSLNYNSEQIQLIVKRPGVNCTKRFANPGQLNYPSFSVVFSSKWVVRYTRIVTNVGEAGSVYNVVVDVPSSVGITVKPSRLVFEKVGERKRYTVTFVSKKGADASKVRNGFGSILWTNAQHQVRSPIAFAWTELLV